MLSLGFSRSTSDFSLFFKSSNDSLLLLLVYVDDILVTCDSKKEDQAIITTLSSHFVLKIMGALYYVLGLDVTKI